MISKIIQKVLLTASLWILLYFSSEALQINSTSSNSNKICLYDKFEFTFSLDQTFKNPFDPDDVKIEAIFTDSENNQVSIPAFYYQEGTRTLKGNDETVELIDSPLWKVRFSPTLPGDYSFDIYVNNQKVNLSSFRFECIQGQEKGFVKKSAKAKNNFQFDNGEYFYPIGHNIRFLKKDQFTQGIPLNKGTFLLEELMQKMSLNGENFLTIGMEAWWLGLEWNASEDKYYGGIGKYNLKNAWMLDKIVDKAYERDIYLGLFLASHGQYAQKSAKWPDGHWEQSPYNTANGGYLSRPNDFFKNPEASKSFKKLIRYITARWGYSPHIFSWLLLSEGDLTQDYIDVVSKEKWAEYKDTPEALTKWHKEMANFIKSVDPYKHLISTSFAFISHGFDIWKLPEMDFVFNTAFISQYGDNMIDLVKSYYELSSPYQKPFMFAEYGGHARGNDASELAGNFYTGIWAQYMNPYIAGCTGFWWWSFIESQDLYSRYKGLADYNLGEEQFMTSFTPISVTTSNNQLGGLGKMTRDRHYLWFFDNKIRYMIMDLMSFKEVTVTYKILSGGKFKIEFWDTQEGEIIGISSVLSEPDGTIKFKLPTFTGDLACKVMRLRE